MSLLTVIIQNKGILLCVYKLCTCLGHKEYEVFLGSMYFAVWLEIFCIFQKNRNIFSSVSAVLYFFSVYSFIKPLIPFNQRIYKNSKLREICNVLRMLMVKEERMRFEENLCMGHEKEKTSQSQMKHSPLTLAWCLFPNNIYNFF